MKFWFTAVTLLLTSAVAQPPLREYLVRLPGREFPASLRARGITPLHHQGELWVVRAADEKILRQTTEEMAPAAQVTIEVLPGTDLSPAITQAGGMVTRNYQSLSAVSAFLPASKIGAIQKLPGVKRVRRSRDYRAFQAGHE